MTKMNVGFLHPGEMGISLAASAQNSGHTAYWASEGRSPQTHARAAKLELVDSRTLKDLCAACSVIVSICPPEAAEKVATEVMSCSFHGLYVDANAISPQRAIHLGEMMEKAGIIFVDGGVIGGPAWERGTWLYLSGKEAERAAGCFTAGPLDTCVLGESVGKASALKMCYAAYTKGTRALLLALLAAAEKLAVRGDLEKQWARDESEYAAEARAATRPVASKAWRYVGEMEEIAATFTAAGIPGGFHQAAAEIFRRCAHFKEAPERLSFETLLQALLQGKESRAA